MPLTVSRQFTAPSGGTISITKRQPNTSIAPLPVEFEVDLSSANFDCSSTYDPLRDLTFTGPYDPQYHRLEAFWSFGESTSAIWDAVENVVPVEYARKNSGRGLKTQHVYTEAAMASGGTTYTVNVLVYEPSSGKVATASTTVQVLHPYFEADKIVLVNKFGDSDFSAFDATETALTSAGWTGTRVDGNCDEDTVTGGGASLAFEEDSTLFVAHRNTDNCVWLFKGNDETGNPVFENTRIVEYRKDYGANPSFGAYGAGRAKHTKTRTLAESGFGQIIQTRIDATNEEPIRVQDWWVEGESIADEEARDSSQGEDATSPAFDISQGWWFIGHNLRITKWGRGNMAVRTRTVSSLISLTLANCTILDTNTEYTVLAQGVGGVTGTHPVAIIGCNFQDFHDKLQPDAKRNSFIRTSQSDYAMVCKSRIFVNKSGSGQFCWKMANSGLDGAFYHAYFNVMEASEGGIALFGEFREYNVVVECNIFIYPPYGRYAMRMVGEGMTFRSNACFAPAYANASFFHGSSASRARSMVYILYSDTGVGTKTPTPVYVGAPNEVYGNTMVCDWNATQLGGSGDVDDFIDIYVGTAWDGVTLTADVYDAAQFASLNVRHFPNQTTPITSEAGAGLIDSAFDSSTGPLTALGNRISPLTPGRRISSGFTTDLDQTGAELPTLKLNTSSAAYQANSGIFEHVQDYLGRRRGPKQSIGAAEDQADANVVEVAVS